MNCFTTYVACFKVYGEEQYECWNHNSYRDAMISAKDYYHSRDIDAHHVIPINYFMPKLFIRNYLINKLTILESKKNIQIKIYNL